jgi:uncharacterized metal-binding protein YceD (DUF177 family)
MMDNLSKYEIAFKGLKEGDHQFKFELDEKFFEKFENSEVQKGLVKCKVNLRKTSNLMILEMAVKGAVELMCHRCLDNYMQAIKSKNKLFVKFGAEAEEMSDDLIVLTLTDDNINVAQYLYELVILSLPLKHVHPLDHNGDSTCNSEMEEKLKNYLVTEDQIIKKKNEPEVDERWNELKKLLDNEK